MTFGALKFRLSKAFPGVDADLIEGWVADCYGEILGAVPWSRLDVQDSISTEAAKQTYALPANCRFVDEDGFAGLRKLTPEEALRDFKGLTDAGEPRVWWPSMDDSSTPPKMQVSVFPVPDAVYALPYTYSAEAATPSGSSFTLLAWTSPAALIEGTTAKIKRHLKDYAGAALAKAAYNDALSNMRSDEAYRRGPLHMEMGGYYTRHRAGRWQR